MPCSWSILTPVLNQYKKRPWNISTPPPPPGSRQEIGAGGGLQQSSAERGEGEKDLHSDKTHSGPVRKSDDAAAVSRLGNTWNRRRAVIPGLSVNLSVCVCARVQKHAWWVSVPPCCVSPPPAVFLPLFQVPLVALDGLFDAQQQRGVPLVQAGDGVELFYLRGGELKWQALVFKVQ